MWSTRRMKILFAPDKFKGSLTAGEAAEAMCRGWLSQRKQDDGRCQPLSDGGEGFAQVCCPGVPAETVFVSGPAGDVVEAEFFKSRNAVFLETATACGLALVPGSARNPSQTTTKGVGELLRHLATIGIPKVFAGLGGSGTNDGGVGMATALGYRFLDARGVDLTALPLGLNRLKRIVPPGQQTWPAITAATDVCSPLLGPEGCTRNFGSQKGMCEADVPAFEDALGQLASVVECDLGKSAASIPGSGAAGGLGFGLAVFCNAEIVRGFELVSSLIGLEKMVSEVDVVVTGEGSLDAQSLSGKAPVALAALAASKGKPILCVAGRIDTSLEWGDKFYGLLSTCECAGSHAAALADASGWLQEACRRLCETWEMDRAGITGSE